MYEVGEGIRRNMIQSNYVMESPTNVNVNLTAPGATTALGLLFLKTSNKYLMNREYSTEGNTVVRKPNVPVFSVNLRKMAE